MAASKNLPEAVLSEVISVLYTVGLPESDPFGFRGFLQRHNFDNGAAEWDETDAGVRFVIRKASDADQVTSIEVVADHTRHISQEDIDFANEDLADILG